MEGAVLDAGRISRRVWINPETGAVEPVRRHAEIGKHLSRKSGRARPLFDFGALFGEEPPQYRTMAVRLILTVATDREVRVMGKHRE
jgi:hypothetical protein